MGEPVEVRPLQGLLVVDLSSLWAGPTCARLLTGAGATVVKVESATRPDGARRGNRDFYERLHAGQEERSVAFETAAGVAELRALLAEADVIIEGSRPRALERLGIEPTEVVADRPGAVWLSITAYGRSGPWRNRVGFGDDCAAAGGLVAWTADGSPAFVADAVADPLTGMVAAALVAAGAAGRRWRGARRRPAGGRPGRGAGRGAGVVRGTEAVRPRAGAAFGSRSRAATRSRCCSPTGW